jgi:flagellin-specific chaperone FliS
MSDIANAYLTQQVECSEPGKLTELLYRRAIHDLYSAVELWPELKVSAQAIFLMLDIVEACALAIRVRDETACTGIRASARN